MSNIKDYLDWRGDICFSHDGFNEVDNLVFSVFSYLEFDGVVPPQTEQDSILLRQVASHSEDLLEQPSIELTRPFFETVPRLLQKAARLPRFCEIPLSHYINQVDFDRSEQFSALVFSIQDDLHFVAFSGTDNTLAGWKEDLQMSFLDEVPAQKQAVEYLINVMSDLNGNFYLGGHSKGGNLAVYSSAFAPKGFQDRIVRVFNNDGPGFQDAVIQSDGYQQIASRITTFLPQTSIVGMLLEHRGEYRVVGSNETGIMQHNPLSWKVLGTGFVYEEGLSKSSLAINSAIRAWLDKLPRQEREEFVNALFDILLGTGVNTVSELSQEKLTAAKSIIQNYKNLEPTAQSNLRKVVDIFFSESQKMVKETIEEQIGLFLSKTKSILKPDHSRDESQDQTSHV